MRTRTRLRISQLAGPFFLFVLSVLLAKPAETQAAAPESPNSREFKIQKHYLNIPIKNGAPKRVVKTFLEGKVETRNEIELADHPAAADWWAAMYVTAYNGKPITLEVEKLPAASRALAAIEPSDQLKDAANLYREVLRGQFHFSPMRGWNNDPN